MRWPGSGQISLPSQVERNDVIVGPRKRPNDVSASSNIAVSVAVTPETPSVERIGDHLVREKLVTRDQLNRALDEQRSHGGRIGYHLVKLGYVDELALARALARQYKVPAVDLTRSELDPA